MAVQAQASITSSQYANNRAPDTDSLYGSSSRDFCNSFWGPGDDGVNILFSRMRGAIKTTDELRQFWNERYAGASPVVRKFGLCYSIRAAIEEQYATRLAALSKYALGGDEIGCVLMIFPLAFLTSCRELRASLDTLRQETGSQAEAHTELASGIRSRLETPASHFHAKQVNHRRNVQAAVEKKFKTKQTQESYVAKAKEKYDGDCVRIQSYTQQLGKVQGKDLERIQLKLRRAQQTVQANEKDYANFTQVLLDLMPGWEMDWKDFCDSSQDLEEERLDFMKDHMWTYANESCEQVRTVLDQFDPERDVKNFVMDYGTGNRITVPATFIPYNFRNGSSPPELVVNSRPVAFSRVSRRIVSSSEDQQQQEINGHEPASPVSPDVSIWQQEPRPANGTPPQQPLPQPEQPQNNDRGREEGTQAGSYSTTQQVLNGYLSGPPTTEPPTPQPSQPQPQEFVPPSTVSPPSRSGSHRVSGPLPVPGNQYMREEQPPLPAPPPPQPEQETGCILFYVKALYDYNATIEEEFDFQAGDVIAVTATPDDGWWSGELLDEARREEGRHIFPSNFVCLF
ncbi:hypothetical protein DXG03_008247 [Asterophora parasitica]|uniref:SH3 domain-containing protein n=1 Tax=Asterophora parasitica TaxID=117018 RepID=A0A9P7KD36_9AGAR|nr:hypothetical protein DXG03_008247 [Asterophora parasitica]